LWREWQALGVTEQRTIWFWKYAVEPALSPSLLQRLGRLRGRRFVSPFERLVPPWMRTAATRSLDLEARAMRALPAHHVHGAAHGELRWYFENAGFSRLSAVMQAAIHAQGVEARSPLHDRRLVQFAAEGTGAERFAHGETKVLLRHAMKPLLPPSVLRARDRRTGTLATRFDASMRGIIAALHERGNTFLLADLGLLDVSALKIALAQAERAPASYAWAEALIRTAHVESYLQYVEVSAAPRSAYAAPSVGDALAFQSSDSEVEGGPAITRPAPSHDAAHAHAATPVRVAAAPAFRYAS
jgi:hypothetical protein